MLAFIFSDKHINAKINTVAVKHKDSFYITSTPFIFLKADQYLIRYGDS